MPLASKTQADGMTGTDTGRALGVRSAGPRAHPAAHKVLKAARNILPGRGQQGVTLPTIWTEAQVNTAGVRCYFGSKQQLTFAVLEDITADEPLNVGTLPPCDVSVEERADLPIGAEGEPRGRVTRFRAVYEVLPEASRDDELRRHLISATAAGLRGRSKVLEPAFDALAAPALGQFASLLLEGILMQMAVGTTDFDLAAALPNARRSLSPAAA
jgi:AcrR family transcriptional regulator